MMIETAAQEWHKGATTMVVSKL